MRAIRITTISIFAAGLLAGSAVGVAAQEGSAAAVVDVGALEPGMYVDHEYLGPQVRFTVGEGWSVADVGDGLLMLGWGGTGRQVLSLLTFDGRVNAAPCYMPDEGREGDVAVMDVLGWLAQPENVMMVDATQSGFWNHLAGNPHLDVGERTDVQVSGRSGQQADVHASVGDGCFEDATFLWYTPYEGTWELASGERARFTTLDIEDGVVVMDARTSAGDADHDAFLAAVDGLIETLLIGEPPAELPLTDSAVCEGRASSRV